MLVACDLDGTLIYSARALALPHTATPELVCVETLDGRPASFMTVSAANAMEQLADVATVVPVTVRSPEQLARVRLPGASRYAVAANGGRLFVDGVVDPGWSRRVAEYVSDQCPFAQLRAHVAEVEKQGWLHRARGVEELFCYGIVDLATVPRDAVAAEVEYAAELGWRLSLQGRKLYWVPRGLDKAIAVSELVERLGMPALLAAGDSGLDAEMLRRADAAIRPAHGELHRTGWNDSRVAVTSTVGVLAGEQIAEWLLAEALRRRAGAALLAAPPPDQQQDDDDDERGDVSLRRQVS